MYRLLDGVGNPMDGVELPEVRDTVAAWRFAHGATPDRRRFSPQIVRPAIPSLYVLPIEENTLDTSTCSSYQLWITYCTMYRDRARYPSMYVEYLRHVLLPPLMRFR